VSDERTPPRFRDGDTRASEFLGDILVECPKCGGCARDLVPRRGERRLSCTGCGHVAERVLEVGVFYVNREPRDAYFDVPLWLSAPCCGEVLWAYNLAHLDFIEAFVCATLREPARHPDWGWQNSGLASRLPRWMQLASHREEILRTVRKLRAKR
jgi:hypothetical protein